MSFIARRMDRSKPSPGSMAAMRVRELRQAAELPPRHSANHTARVR